MAGRAKADPYGAPDHQALETRASTGVTVCFVKHLTVRDWCVSIAPRLIWWRLTERARVDRYDFIEASRPALALARASAWVTGVTVEPFRGRLWESCDAHGVSLLAQVMSEDALAVQAEIVREPAFCAWVSEPSVRGRLPAYLTKALSPCDLSDGAALWCVLLLIRVCASGSRAVLFLDRRPWMRVITRYAVAHGVTVIPVPPPFNPRGWLRRCLPTAVRLRLREVRWRLRTRRRNVPAAGAQRDGTARPRIAVEYGGHFNLHQPEQYSNLFFWQQSSLSGRDILLCFTSPRDPLDGEKLAQLTTEGIGAAVLHPDGATTPEALALSHRPTLRRMVWDPLPSRRRWPRSPEAVWLRMESLDYQIRRHDWTQFFEAHRIKMFLSWFKYDGMHCAIADALRQLGGIAALHQFAYELQPAAHTMVATDLLFGFSEMSAAIERRSGSRIPYYVVTGYLGDHRFPLLRGQAQRVRAALQQRGARRILGFADENSVDDSPWLPGHESMRRDYAFLLEKVLQEPWLGVVLKPKVPSTLRRRLGAVAELLARAEATGRCFIYEAGVTHGSYPPAAAALASDLMVHGHLYAATAGIESALAGVPTLLLDREGWSLSPLYRLGVGRVIFSDWETLWNACLEHWTRPHGLPGLVDWGSQLEAFHPFRDRRAP